MSVELARERSELRVPAYLTTLPPGQAAVAGSGGATVRVGKEPQDTVGGVAAGQIILLAAASSSGSQADKARIGWPPTSGAANEERHGFQHDAARAARKKNMGGD